MSKKFSIAKGLDIRELNIQIGHYKYETGNRQPYLFMNEDTLNKLGMNCVIQFGAKALDDLEFNKTGRISHYDGYKIFCDNTLSFGEVEIR